MPKHLTAARVLKAIGLFGAVFLLALTCYIYVVGSLPIVFGVFHYPFAAIILPIYVVGIAIRKTWAFYFAFFACLFWVMFWLFFVVLLQHVIFFFDPESSSVSFWDFEKTFWQFSWLWGISVIFLFCGVVGSGTILTRCGYKLFRNVRIKGKVLPLWEILIVVAIVAFLMGILLPALGKQRRTLTPQIRCGTNLLQLGNAMRIYASDYDDRYPTEDKWCDLLVEYSDVDKSLFICKGAERKGDQGRCHYAINPNCELNSPNDVVLLFETKGGWNQFGGPELLTTENHKGKGCNILFNDGYVEFAKPSEFDKLNWGDERKQ